MYLMRYSFTQMVVASTAWLATDEESIVGQDADGVRSEYEGHRLGPAADLPLCRGPGLPARVSPGPGLALHALGAACPHSFGLGGARVRCQ